MVAGPAGKLKVVLVLPLIEWGTGAGRSRHAAYMLFLHASNKFHGVAYHAPAMVPVWSVT